MREILEKFGFVKQDKNTWAFWDDYLLDDLNPNYPHFLRVTVHIPKGKGGNIEYQVAKVILHRSFDRQNIHTHLQDGDSKLVYEGFLETQEDFEFVLNKTGIFPLTNS